MSHRHPKTIPGAGTKRTSTLRNQIHRMLSYSALVKEAARRIHEEHTLLYRHVMSRDNEIVTNSVNPDFVTCMADDLKLCLDLVENVENRARVFDCDTEDTPGRGAAAAGVVQHPVSSNDASVSDFSSESDDGETDVIPTAVCARAVADAFAHTADRDTETDCKALEPPRLTRNDTEITQPSETNQESPSTAAETAPVVVDQP